MSNYVWLLRKPQIELTLVNQAAAMTNHNILLLLCSLAAPFPFWFLSAYVHPSGVSPRPLKHQQRPHFKQSCQEVTLPHHKCLLKRLAFSMDSLQSYQDRRVSRSWLPSRMTIKSILCVTECVSPHYGTLYSEKQGGWINSWAFSEVSNGAPIFHPVTTQFSQVSASRCCASL